MSYRFLYSVFFFILISLSLFSVFGGGTFRPNEDCGAYERQKISINSMEFIVDISNDECKRSLGLSGRTSISDDGGMIFIFEDDASHGFWMKDMNFPLDILWLNKDGEIIWIENNIQPVTYPEIYGENVISRSVVEIKSGLVGEGNVKIGDRVIILNKE